MKVLVTNLPTGRVMIHLVFNENCSLSFIVPPKEFAKAIGYPSDIKINGIRVRRKDGEVKIEVDCPSTEDTLVLYLDETTVFRILREIAPEIAYVAPPFPPQ